MTPLKLCIIVLFTSVLQLTGVYWITQPLLITHSCHTNTATLERNIDVRPSEPGALARGMTEPWIEPRIEPNTDDDNRPPNPMVMAALVRIQDQLQALLEKNASIHDPALDSGPISLSALPSHVDTPLNEQSYLTTNDFVADKIAQGSLSLADQETMRDQYRFLTIEQIIAIEYRINEAFQQGRLDIE